MHVAGRFGPRISYGPEAISQEMCGEYDMTSRLRAGYGFKLSPKKHRTRSAGRAGRAQRVVFLRAWPFGVMAFTSASLIRVCHPGPRALKCAITAVSRRSVT